MTPAKQTLDGKVATRRAIVALLAFAGFAVVLFQLSPENLYLWVKALHVTAVMAWMAGLFYLPRLFVYHADTVIGSEQSELFKVMERRLLRAIMNPAMMFSWLFGLWVAWDGFQFRGGWLHVKILAVIVLTVFHVHLSKSVRVFANDQNQKSSRYWRMMNEVPTLLMFIIVILVVVKPF